MTHLVFDGFTVVAGGDEKQHDADTQQRTHRRSHRLTDNLLESAVT
jgi:hypothetical protein